jgi:ketosteroid isomerase-like protein
MRIASALVLMAVAPVLVLSCAAPQVDMTALRKTVDDYNAASKEAMTTGNSDKVMAYYQDDAMEMAPNMAVAKGKDAIKAMEDQMMKSGMKVTAVNFTTTDLQAAGTIAYELGTYDMTMTMAPTGEVKDQGKYVVIWHQQADGTWKVRAEIWNSDNPMPAVGEKHEEMKKEEMKKGEKMKK